MDKFVGDEAIGLFFRGVSGAQHSASAIHAAHSLLDAVGRADATERGPIPVGAAVHTGEAFVGSTGAEGAVNDFTALGDVVNTTARLASEAVAGELLVSEEAAAAAGRRGPGADSSNDHGPRPVGPCDGLFACFTAARAVALGLSYQLRHFNGFGSGTAPNRALKASEWALQGSNL